MHNQIMQLQYNYKKQTIYLEIYGLLVFFYFYNFILTAITNM